MKALTICQPYAHLIVAGEKRVENRTWPTSYRGHLAIHAGKSRSWLAPGDEAFYPGMVFGAVVAIARLADCVRLSNLPADLKGHEHAHGPWCWLLEDVTPFPKPFPARGAQGLWEWTR